MVWPEAEIADAPGLALLALILVALIKLGGGGAGGMPSKAGT